MSSPGAFPPVVLIDDNADDLFVLKQRLLRGGVENPIISFEDGEEAMAHFKRAMSADDGALPGLVLLDLRMPRCGGFEVLKWMRSQPALAGTPVVIVTTSALPEDAIRAKQLGANAFVSKYPSPETLAELVKSANGRGGR